MLSLFPLFSQPQLTPTPIPDQYQDGTPQRIIQEAIQIQTKSTLLPVYFSIRLVSPATLSPTQIPTTLALTLTFADGYSASLNWYACVLEFVLYKRTIIHHKNTNSEHEVEQWLLPVQPESWRGTCTCPSQTRSLSQSAKLRCERNVSLEGFHPPSSTAGEDEARLRIKQCSL